jgi:tellurite resistance protein TerB
MANRYGPPGTTTAEQTTHYLDYRDEEIMQGLVTAGALVALADGEVKTAERAELADFIDRQGFAPASSQTDITEAFDSRVRELEGPNCAKVIVETLRPLTGRSLASILVRTAQRVAAADQKIHPGELRALNLIRRIMMSLPASTPEIDRTTIGLLQNSTECDRCGTVFISSAWSESTASQIAGAIWRCPMCGHEIETIKSRVGEKLPDDLVRAFFPNLLVA